MDLGDQQAVEGRETGVTKQGGTGAPRGRGKTSGSAETETERHTAAETLISLAEPHHEVTSTDSGVQNAGPTSEVDVHDNDLNEAAGSVAANQQSETAQAPDALNTSPPERTSLTPEPALKLPKRQRHYARICSEQYYEFKTKMLLADKNVLNNINDLRATYRMMRTPANRIKWSLFWYGNVPEHYNLKRCFAAVYDHVQTLRLQMIAVQMWFTYMFTHSWNEVGRAIEAIRADTTDLTKEILGSGFFFNSPPPDAAAFLGEWRQLALYMAGMTRVADLMQITTQLLMEYAEFCERKKGLLLVLGKTSPSSSKLVVHDDPDFNTDDLHDAYAFFEEQAFWFAKIMGMRCHRPNTLAFLDKYPQVKASLVVENMFATDERLQEGLHTWNLETQPPQPSGSEAEQAQEQQPGVINTQSEEEQEFIDAQLEEEQAVIDAQSDESDAPEYIDTRPRLATIVEDEDEEDFDSEMDLVSPSTMRAESVKSGGDGEEGKKEETDVEKGEKEKGEEASEADNNTSRRVTDIFVEGGGVRVHSVFIHNPEREGL